MSSLHHVVFLSGLGNGEQSISFLLQIGKWKEFGLQPVVPLMRWHDLTEPSYKLKQERLITIIEHIQRTGGRVSLVGVSAGGSAALNIFMVKKLKIHKVMNVCGRLRRGTNYGFRSFADKTAKSQAFAESVLLFEKNEHTLQSSDRQRIMTVHSRFGDELVPPETTNIEGAYNIQVPMVEHVMSIATALTLFSKPLKDFLLEG